MTWEEGISVHTLLQWLGIHVHVYIIKGEASSVDTIYQEILVEETQLILVFFTL